MLIDLEKIKAYCDSRTAGGMVDNCEGCMYEHSAQKCYFYCDELYVIDHIPAIEEAYKQMEKASAPVKPGLQETERDER